MFKLDIRKVLPQAKRNDPEHCPLALAYKEAINKVTDNQNFPIAAAIREFGPVIKVEILGNTGTVTFTNGNQIKLGLSKALCDCVRVFDETGSWPDDKAEINCTDGDEDFFDQIMFGKRVNYATDDDYHR